MINSNLILRQGYKPLVLLLGVAIFCLLFISNSIANLLFIALFFILFIYRNPTRHIFENTQSILSPIDGKVIAIDHIDGKQKIYCKVNLCNTHVVRAPQTGTIKIKKIQHGLNLNPNSYKAKLLNEQISIKFNDIKLKLISGICNSKIEAIEKTKVNQGENIGVFLEGIAILTVKNDNNLSINIGDKLTAGQTILFRKN